MISLMIALLIYSFVPSVFASSSTALGSENGLSPPEISADSAVAGLIANCSSMIGYSAYNWYGTQTTASNVYTAAAGNGAPYASGVPHSTTFYIGNGGITTYYSVQPPFAFNQYFILDNNGGSVYDNDIWGYTASQETNFAFLWSCEQGDEIGGTNWYSYIPPATLAYGMPHAWLHTTSLSSDGYAYPDASNLCFVGFNGSAPWLTDSWSYAGDIQDFLLVFYRKGLLGGYSVNNALNYAAENVWGTPFLSCWLRTGYTTGEGPGNMMVYGDGNIQLKPVNPLFAMKTLVNGWFYMPNSTQPVQFVKVEEWFTNSKAEGDQEGTSVVGYRFQFPDGYVDLGDLIALTHAYNSHEGGPKWNYQEDILPDRSVDLGDLTVLANNYNAHGSWYSTNIGSLSIKFHFADNSNQTAYPDSNGFVAVPWNCTDWTVYNQGTPVGAFLTFWG